jgi:hypothetical protein
MADDGSKTASTTCARCPRHTTNRCTGCLEAPVYDEGVSEPTFYCSQVCQKAEWGQHKSECRKLQARKTLGRAAVLLQAIIYRIRLHASPLPFKSARIEGSIIFLDRFQIDGLDTQRQLKSFPVCLDDNRSLLEPVLVYMGCMETMMYLYSFFKEILASMSTLSSIYSPELDTDLLLIELCSKIEEVNVSVNDQKLRISVILPSGHRFDPSESFFHNVYRATLKNGRDMGSGHYKGAIRICRSSMSLA